MDRNAVKDILTACHADTRVFAKTVFPERFYLPFSQLHDQIYQAIDSGEQRIAIAAPRGFGKTSTINMALPAKKILFREKKFIVPISNTASQAMLQSENLKKELLMNQDIARIFGPMKSDSFSKEMWTTSTGTMVFPRGAGQQVRGVSNMGARPDLIILDDFENSEDVKNEETRKKNKEWFFADVCNSINRAGDWQIIMVGTILHEDALLTNLLDDPNWYSLQLSICDDEYHSNWPDFMSDREVKKLADSYRQNGMLDVFYREYRNIPISTEDAIFRQEYFRYYDEAEEKLDANPDIENIILVDPAKTVKLHSAESAVICVGVDTKKGKVYVRDVVADKLYPDQLYDYVFQMAQRYRCRVVGIEVTSLNEFITYPIKNEMLKRGQMFQLVELKARAKKEERIAAMVPFYRSGYVFHNTHNCTQVETQLLSFPRCKRFDVIDALAYFVEMLDLGERFFTPQDDEFNQDEDDYSALEREMTLKPLRTWRVA